MAVKHSNHIALFMLAGAVIGFLFPGDYLFLVTPLLFVMMSFSLCNLRLSNLSGHEKKFVFQLLALTYVVQGGMLIALSYFFVHNPVFRQSFYILALMPPAVAVIPLSYVLKGNTKEALVSEVFGYVLALFVIPIFAYLLIGSEVSVIDIIQILLVLIIGPFIISRFIRKSKLIMEKVSDKVVKLTFFGIYFALFAVNKNSLFDGVKDIPVIFIITVITTFIIPTIVYFIVKNHKERVDIALFSSMKNVGIASGIVLPVIGIAGTVPITINLFVSVFFLIYFEWLIKRF